MNQQYFAIKVDIDDPDDVLDALSDFVQDVHAKLHESKNASEVLSGFADVLMMQIVIQGYSTVPRAEWAEWMNGLTNRFHTLMEYLKETRPGDECPVRNRESGQMDS